MKTVKFIFTAAFLLGTQIIFAAPGPPSTGGPVCWPPPCVPVDGGISFLVAAGAALGAKKIYGAYKNSKSVS